MTRDNYLEDDDESRRSFMKKGALASSVAALGLASGGTAATNATLQETPNQETPNTALVFIDDYDPGVPFTVVTQMEQSTVNEIFAERQDDTTIIDPSNYNGYVVHEQYDEAAHGNFWFVFAQQATLETGQTYSLSEQVSFFSSELSLVKTQIRTVEAEEDDGDETEGEETETTTTEGEETETTTTETETETTTTETETTTTETETTTTETETTTEEETTTTETTTTDDEETEEVVVNATETTTTEE